MNISIAKRIIEKITEQGVNEFVVCAGARNAPLVKLLGLAKNIRVSHFFDERAAAFFALGRVKRDGNPVAVVTTSGTAAAELLPAAVEAYYSGYPLVLITADRPRSYRATGSPQTINQVGLFQNFIAREYDISDLKAVDDLRVSHEQSVHINVCFDEPLIDEPLPEEFRLPVQTALSKQSQSLNSNAQAQNGTNATGEKSDAPSDAVENFFAKAQRPLVLVGALPKNMRGATYEFLKQWGAPIIAEAPSGLRESSGLANVLQKAGGSHIHKENFRQYFDSVLRLGSIPTLRLWRDLEHELKDIPVLSVSSAMFSGLARDNQSLVAFEDFFHLQSCAELKCESHSELAVTAKKHEKKLETLLQKNPQSEAAWVRALSEMIPAGSQIMLGNSLPIREWDLAATTLEQNFDVFANRGANGIDGLIATFLGAARPETDNWLILGDLSALYDLNALTMTASVPSTARLRVVVLNNRGGQIFRTMFRDKNFTNEHQFEFSKWAAMFNWDYMMLTKKSHRKKLRLLSASPTVIEIQADAGQDDEFWGAL